jgi:hypothetical protein
MTGSEWGLRNEGRWRRTSSLGSKSRVRPGRHRPVALQPASASWRSISDGLRARLTRAGEAAVSAVAAATCGESLTAGRSGERRLALEPDHAVPAVDRVGEADRGRGAGADGRDEPVAQPDVQAPHPDQPGAQRELGGLVEALPALQDQDLEPRQAVERTPATLRPVGPRQHALEFGTGQLEVNDGDQPLELVARLRQTGEAIFNVGRSALPRYPILPATNPTIEQIMLLSRRSWRCPAETGSDR